MTHTKIVNRVYTLNSSLDFYLLFKNLTTYNYNISYVHYHNGIFSFFYNSMMFKDICKWDQLLLRVSFWSNENPR